MTTKTVAVQLVALTQQYQKAMGSATASTAKLEGAASGAGKTIGSVMGPQVAIAGVVVAGVAVKMALDFDKAFTKIGAITDASQTQVAQWKDEVMALSGETARSPQELADALYFLASAGLDASEVMPTLEKSAQAAAVGLGETGDIARLTANAMNAYADSGLTATQVTDTLVAAVREGTAEPTEFADALGRILPVASKAGISFDQVTASLSSLSNIGLDVNEGVTAMRGLLLALEAPGSQAAQALDDIGLSADDVRRSLSEDGLIGTLRLLDKRTGGNIDQLRKIVPNVRALTGAFGLTEQEAKKVDEIFHKVQDSSGDASTAFEETADSVNFKLTQAFVDLQRVGIQLGDVLLPIVSDLAGAVSDILGPLIAVIDKTEEFIATHKAAGDVASHVGDTFKENLIPGLGLIKTLFGDDTDKVKNFNAATQEGATEASRYGSKIEGVGDAADGASGPVKNVGDKVKDTAKELADAEKAAKGFSDALDALTKVAFDVEDAQIKWHQGLIDLRKELKTGTKTLDINTQAGIDNREALKDQLENALAVGIAMREKGKSESEAARITKEHVDQVRAEAIAAGFSKEEIDDYIRVLKLTPKEIRTLIKLQGKDKAQHEIDNFIRNNDGRVVGIRIETSGGGLIATGGGHQTTGHAGGVVGSLPRYHTGGTIKPDERVVVARVGETIRTRAQEQALISAKSGSGSSGTTKVYVINRIYPKLDRRRYTEESDYDAIYSGRW
jgi:TP901 family phage tail tape measure protein